MYPLSLEYFTICDVLHAADPAMDMAQALLIYDIGYCTLESVLRMEIKRYGSLIVFYCNSSWVLILTLSITKMSLTRLKHLGIC